MSVHAGISEQESGISGGPLTMPSKRRRSFLAARGTESGASPMRTEEPFPAVLEDDDIPILTEVVTAEEEKDVEMDAAPPGAETPVAEDAPAVEEAPPASDLEALAARMAQAIDQQMAYELPTLIEATLLDVVANLRAGIASTVKAALRDFVAGQGRPNDE
jgi:hypothetical protein